MGLWSWFTSGGKQVDKITDAVVNTGDALFYTDEEKSATAERQRELYFKFLELARDENSIKSITRRILAFAVIGQWLLLINVCVVLKLTGNTDGAAFVFSVIESMFWFVFAIGSFYFGAAILRDVKTRLS